VSLIVPPHEGCCGSDQDGHEKTNCGPENEREREFHDTLPPEKEEESPRTTYCIWRADLIDFEFAMKSI
jgi:hypothetical protein